MASLQTNAVLSNPNAANAAIKSSLPPAGSDDFAALLSGAAAPDKSQVQPKAQTKSQASNTDAAPTPRHSTQTNSGASSKTDSKTDSKLGRKSAAKPDDAANAKPDSTKPETAGIAAQAQRAADGTDADTDSDATGDSAGTDTPTAANQNTAVNQNSVDAAAQTIAQIPQPQQPAAQQDAQAQPMMAAATLAATTRAATIPAATTPAAITPAATAPVASTPAASTPAATIPAAPQANAPVATANDNNNVAPAKDSNPQTSVQVPPAQPSQEAQPSQKAQPPQPQQDASAQVQQMLAAATPAMQTNAPAAPANAPAAPPSANDNNNVAAIVPAAQAGRPQAPRPPASPANNDAAAPAAGKTESVAQSDTQKTGITADASGVQNNLPSASHQDGKTQTADVKTDTAQQPQVSEAAPPPPAPQPTSQPTPQPAPQPSGLAATVAGVGAFAPATAPGVAAGPALAASIHVGPQGPTPNVNSLAVEIAARSQSGAREFQIRLDPPELGHVEVRLSIDASGKAEAHMTADQQQTLDLLQKNSPTLTSALRDAGLDVSQSGLNFSLRGQDRQGSDNARDGAQTRGASQSLAATRTIDAVQSANPYLSSAGDARLDIHV